MGKPKVGKSRAMAQLPDALIVATDIKGYEAIDAEALWKAPTLEEVYAAMRYFFSEENKTHKILVIDEIRMLTQMFDETVKVREGLKYSIDLGFGRGAAYVKDDIFNFVQLIRSRLDEHKDKRVFIVAHATDRGNEVRMDINGKNENMVLGLVDAVGYIMEVPTTGFTITFNGGKGVEYGARNPYLGQFTGATTWQKLFDLAEGKDLIIKKTKDASN